MRGGRIFGINLILILKIKMPKECGILVYFYLEVVQKVENKLQVFKVFGKMSMSPPGMQSMLPMQIFK